MCRSACAEALSMVRLSGQEQSGLGHRAWYLAGNHRTVGVGSARVTHVRQGE
jgi:hypothetical protein